MPRPVEPTGLPLVDALAALASPAIEDYCRAAAEYIRQATVAGSARGKAAQIRLSHALAVITTADLERIAVVAFDRETGAVAPDLPPPGTGLRWEEFIATMADAYQARFGDL